jgi:serine/threonine protein kinase/tetratricopeptide (TPR) repeat protein
MDFALPHKIGHYTLTQRLGQGGMGVVYRASDSRLGREVALKMIAGLSDEAAVKRFWREARAAAAVSHPNVCQIFEVNESPDGVYLAMELLAGEPLDARLRKSPCSPADAVNIATQMLAALSALHGAGMVHRDIKPSNVFLTPHGVKLLDFGLARQISDSTVRMEPTDSSGQITRPGMMVGTPRYMSPEQIRGQVVDQRGDLFAVGTVLFEMIAGRPPFTGEGVFDLAQAIMHNNPPALQGPPAVVAIDRVIRRALAKDPADRFPMADAMALELRQIPVDGSSAGDVATVGTLLRVVVPPLRLQREDPDAQFLSYGLAEAVSGSLAAHRDIVVRSPSLAAKWIASDSDPRQLAQQADVDVVVSGTLSRMGDQLRAQIQAIEAKSGTVLGAASVRGSLSEIFAFEDELTKGVVGLLTPLRASSSGRGTNVHRDIPATPRAFELFLRGLELTRTMAKTPDARACFEQALLEDPVFAPAWAWLGRCHRIVGKYIENYVENDRLAEDAFRRALALSPELPVAHRFYTHWESEHGRADAAVARLLQHAKTNRNDAHLFAALVHACRYCGLLGASMAAHEEAKRLDPTVQTSAEYTLLMLGDAERLNKLEDTTLSSGAHAYLMVYTGKFDDVKRNMVAANLDGLPAGYRGMIQAMMDIETDPAGALKAMDDAMAIGASKDPEAVLLQGMLAALLKVDDRAVPMIIHAVDSGFAAARTLEQAPVLAKLRERPEIKIAIEHARQRQRIALAVFERGGGPAMLGIAPEAAL